MYSNPTRSDEAMVMSRRCGATSFTPTTSRSSRYDPVKRPLNMWYLLRRLTRNDPRGDRSVSTRTRSWAFAGIRALRAMADFCET